MRGLVQGGGLLDAPEEAIGAGGGPDFGPADWRSGAAARGHHPQGASRDSDVPDSPDSEEPFPAWPDMWAGALPGAWALTAGCWEGARHGTDAACGGGSEDPDAALLL